MIVTVVFMENEQTFNLNVQNDLLIEDFKALCSADLNVSSDHIMILFNGQPMVNNKASLASCGIKDNDMVLIQRAVAPQVQQTRSGSNNQASPFSKIDFSSIRVPGNSAGSSHQRHSGNNSHELGEDSPAALRQKLLHNPSDLALLKERNPPLAAALEKGDEEFAIELNKIHEHNMEIQRERIRMLNADPFDEEVQKKIAEEIKMKNIQENMNMAIEESPESFGQVYMLWINCKVNNHNIKAFVDSGAQMTIMSSACAERCNINRLVDKRWEGIAKGVGVQKIIGRVHLAQLQIENDFLPCSYSVLEDQPMDMLLGLDMLKRHQCVIDLKENVLRIGTTGTQTKFLSESEIPSHGRLHDPNAKPEDEQMDVQSLEDKEIAKALEESSKEAIKQNGTSSKFSGTSSKTKKATSNNGAAGETSSSNSSGFPEASIKKLLDMGFNRSDAEIELRKSNGDVQQAIVKLLARSLKSQ